MRRVRVRRPGHGTVVAYLALFVALGGTGAYAANTVFSADIVDGEVKTPDLADAGVTQAKLHDGAVARPKLGNGVVSREKINNGAVDGSKVADNSLTGTDVNESTLDLQQTFFVGPADWTSNSAVTVTHGDGNTTVSGTSTNAVAKLPVSYPSRIGGRPLLITSFKICRLLSGGAIITGYGIVTGSGDSPANDSSSVSVSTSGAGCDTITMADLGLAPGFAADGNVTFNIIAFMGFTGSGSAQLGGAQLRLNPS
jgi:hypothetical protein